MDRENRPDLPFALVIRIRAEGVTDLQQRIQTQFTTLAPVALRVELPLQI